MISWLMRLAATVLFILLACHAWQHDAGAHDLAFYGALALWVGSTLIPEGFGPAPLTYRRRADVA